MAKGLQGCGSEGNPTIDLKGSGVPQCSLGERRWQVDHVVAAGLTNPFDLVNTAATVFITSLSVSHCRRNPQLLSPTQEVYFFP